MGRPGLGISFELINYEAAQSLAKKPWTLPIPLAGLEITLAVPQLTVTPDVKSGAVLVDVKAELVVHLQGDVTQWVGRHTLEFVGGTTHPVEAGGRIRLGAGNPGQYRYFSSPRPLEFEKRLALAGVAADAYNQFEVITLTYQTDSYFASVVSAIPIPQLPASLRGLRLASPLQFSLTVHYLVVFADQLVGAPGGCAFGGHAATSVSVQRRPGRGGRAALEIPQPTLAVEPNSTSASPFARPGLLWLLPRQQLVDYSFGRVKPSLTLSDSGTEFLISWQYAVTSALKGIGIGLGMNGNRARVTMDAPIEVIAVAGAGITLGCIRKEILGVQAIGVVDPLRVVAEASLNAGTGEVVIQAWLDGATNVDVDWKSPNIPFPIDRLADFILDRIVHDKVTELVGRNVDVLRLQVSELANILAVGRLVPRSFESDALADTLLLAVDLLPRDESNA